MSNEQSLPENIREKIKSFWSKEITSISHQAVNKIAAFGYHLRDSEVEGLKQQIKLHEANAEYWKKEADETLMANLDNLNSQVQTLFMKQRQTIAELLEGLQELVDLKAIKDRNINELDQMGVDYLHRKPLAWIKAKQLLNKHKPI